MEPPQHRPQVPDAAPRASQPGWLWVSTNGEEGPSVVPARIDDILATGLRTPRKESMSSWAAGPPLGQQRSMSPLRPAKVFPAQIGERLHSAQASAAQAPLADGGAKSPLNVYKVPDATPRAPASGLLASVYKQPDNMRRALPRGWLASVYQDSEDTPLVDEVIKDPVKPPPSNGKTNPESKQMIGCDRLPTTSALQYLITLGDQREAQRRSIRLWETRDVQQEMDELTRSLGGVPADAPPLTSLPKDPLMAALGAAPAPSDDKAAECESKPSRPWRTSAHYLITPGDQAEAERRGHPMASRQYLVSPDRPVVQRRGVRVDGETRDVQQEMDDLALSLGDFDVPPAHEPPTDLPGAAQLAESEFKPARPRRTADHYLITPGDEEKAQRRGIGQSGELRNLQQEIEDLTMSLEELQQGLRKKSGLSPDGLEEIPGGG